MIATPVVLLMLLAIVQFALWSHATHIAQTAASHGLAAARAHGGSAAEGSTSAQGVLDQLGRGPLKATTITSHRDAQSASLDITGTATSVIPLLTLPVNATATGPVERFVPLADGFTNPGTVPAPRAGGRS